MDGEARHLPGAVASLARVLDAEILLVQEQGGVQNVTLERYLAGLRERDPRARLLTAPGRGRAATLNAGLAAARAPLVGFLEPGDRWLADAVPARLSMLRMDASLAMVFGGWRHHGRLGSGLAECRRFNLRHAMWHEGFTLGQDALAQLFAEPVVRLSTVIARRNLLRQLGGFAEQAGAAADWDLWLHVAQSGAVACLPRPVAELALPTWNNAARLASERRISRVWRPIVARQDAAAARLGAARMMAEEARSAAANHRPLRAAALRLGAMAMSVAPLPATAG